jgi:hypothetical protein
MNSRLVGRMPTARRAESVDLCDGMPRRDVRLCMPMSGCCTFLDLSVAMNNADDWSRRQFSCRSLYRRRPTGMLYFLVGWVLWMTDGCGLAS